MRSIVATPDPALLESMRSIGYTIEAAVADVIDNSVAAGAAEVSVMFSAFGPFQIAILDDGDGMSAEETVSAMRLAATSPTASRRPEDLGRFGLGLKTASLSQCRTLTVASKKDGVITVLRWSLDHVISSGDWSLLELDPSEAEVLLGWKEFEGLESGTLVHWGDLDQLTINIGSSQSDLDAVAAHVRDHIALVFHLFSTGDGVRRILFNLNGSPITPIDPFMASSAKTQQTDWEPIEIDGQQVRLKAYTLPYISRLSAVERKSVLSLGQLRDTQGFYIYRGGRLVIWGTWFRVAPRSEMAKLTRVRVDVPNSLDHMWALDVKKSAASPPPPVRNRLKELAKTMMMPSQRTQQFRGRKVNSTARIEHVWNVIENGGRFGYEINIEHPMIREFADELTEDQQRHLEIVLSDIQGSFPIADAHNRMSSDRVPTELPSPEDLIERARNAWSFVKENGVDSDTFVRSLATAEPYCLVPDFTTKLRKALQ